MSEHQHDQNPRRPTSSSRQGWEERYSSDEQIWSGDPNPQLVAEASR